MANTLNLGTDSNWAVKENNLLAYNDENNIFKPIDFDFTRDSGATRVNEQGLIENVPSGVPRIDFSDGKGSLLLEPQATNLYTYSNDVSFWSKSNVVTTSNYAISPDGTQNAFRGLFSSRNGLLYISSTGVVGQNNTLSVWAKSNTSTNQKFRFFGDGTVIISNDFIATDEWQRFEFTYNCSFVTAGLQGASDTDISDILFYGFQHEEGSYATSYIPTSGATATRNAEASSKANISNLIGQTEGVIYVESNNLLPSGTRTLTMLYTSGSAFYQMYLTSSNQIRVDVNGTIIFLGGSVSANTNYKIAFAYKSGEYALYINGTQIATSAITTMPSSLNIFYLGNFNGNEQSGSFKNSQLYNTRLSNEELQQLTS